MEAVRIIKVHIPLEGLEKDKIAEKFKEIAEKYGRKVEQEDINKILERRFGVE